MEDSAAPGQSLQTVTASACGKAIIVGEHAVVYGARAVAMPIASLRMGVRLSPYAAWRRGEPLARVTLGGRSVSEHVAGLVDEAFAVLGLEPTPVEIEGTSTVMVGAGLGSSAALCVVLLRALAAASGRPLDVADLAAFGNRLERRFHGNPSGLDTAVVAWERALAFRRGEAPTAVPLTPPEADGSARWRFALLDTQARSSTMTMIRAAAPYFEAAAGPARIRRFDELAWDVTGGLARGDLGAVAAAMSEAGALLDEAGVVNEAVRDVLAAARAAGARAAKPTGAGGGGCVLALLDPHAAAAQLDQLRERLGAPRVYAVELA